VKRLFPQKSVRIEWAFFGEATTGRGTIFISRSKFSSYRGRGSPGGAADLPLSPKT
jgi:hypothetical protein